MLIKSKILRFVKIKIQNMTETTIQQPIPYNQFIDHIKKKVHSSFHERNNIEKFIQQRGFPYLALRDIMSAHPLSVAIPIKYGGRGLHVKECIGLLETASYESLPLSLAFGINIALFLEPFAKYADESVKASVYNRFLNQQNMGGLMITEPDFGSDAMNMQTSNKKTDSGYHIKGTKHWQGLTGLADYWIITSRSTDANGNLQRDIDFFLCDAQQSNQQIKVEELYNNIGLYPIPYGKNNIDINVPSNFKLQPQTTGLKLMMDLLHRSRFQFPGMGIGFIHRLLDEAIEHCKNRIVSGKALYELDQVKFQIARIQTAYTISSAMCSRSAEISSIENDLTSYGIEANAIKAYITDLMQESAQIFTQLSGAKGYRIESIATRSIIDSRPFQIFEGSNEMLYTQIAEMTLKNMTKLATTNLYDYLTTTEGTQIISNQYKSQLNFTIQGKPSQRKLVDLGKIVSRVLSAQLVAILELKGYRTDLAQAALSMIGNELTILASSYHAINFVNPIVEYRENSEWMQI